MTRRPPARGFTLLEMLFALALMSMLAASLYGSLRTGFRGRRATERVLEPSLRAAAAFEMIRADVESAVVPTGLLAGEFLGVDGEDDAGEPADVLTYHALARDQSADEPPSSVLWVQIALASDEETGEAVLVRRRKANLLAPEDEEPAEEVLCRRVRALDAAFYDGVDWVEAWDSTTMGDVLPLAVEVTVVLDVEGREDGCAFSRVFALPCGELAEEGGGIVRMAGGNR